MSENKSIEPASDTTEPTTPERLSRLSVPELDAILGQSFPVLDQGFVRVIDYMGSDAAVVQAARISYGKGTKSSSDDRGLIRYLMRHEHTTPFEMCEIKLHVRVPMDCWRQWIRHRTASVNEYSTRYSEAIDAAQMTRPEEWRTQSTTNKQGSGAAITAEVGKNLSNAEQEFHTSARKLYSDRLTAGVAREQARKDLPLSTYTEAYWKIDLHNLLRFLRLRMAPQAQLEIRAYANIIGNEVVSRWCPNVWEAYKEYQVDGILFSSVDVQLIKLIVANRTEEAASVATERGLLARKADGSLSPNRERAEIESKLSILGLSPPW